MVKKKVFFILFILFILSGCEDNKKHTEIDKTISTLIKTDETAVNTRNVELAISNYSSEVLTEEIKKLQKESFVNYENLGMTLTTSDIEVAYIKDNEAIVKTINKYRTPEFNPNNNFQNDNDMLHFLVKENNQWKFNFSFIIKRVFLKSNGDLDLNNEEFSGWDETDFWNRKIKDMKKQNILPSKYMEENPID